jgi:acetolactate synthase-1/2/3 large subunit
MGYGVPAAVAARQQYPDRMVIAFAGDGCFPMTGQEFAIAVQYDLRVIVTVIDNGMYGIIRMHQEREYPDRVSGTELWNPDFADYARPSAAMGNALSVPTDSCPLSSARLPQASPRSFIASSSRTR